MSACKEYGGAGMVNFVDEDGTLVAGSECSSCEERKAKSIDFDYRMNDCVHIIPLNVKGRVIGLYLCEDGKQYRIRYFYEGAQHTEYLYADEIEPK
mgnify:FL=1